MATTTTDGSAGSMPRWLRRRKYLINSTFQWKYTMTIAFGVFLVALLMGSVMFGILHEQARERILTGGTSTAYSNARAIGLFSLSLSLVTLAALACWGIIMTHRISGPVFVLERYLKEVGAGRFPTRRPLRKKDEFKDLHNTFWRTVESLKAARRTELNELTDALNIAKSAVPGDRDGCERVFESLVVQIQTMRDDIAEVLGEPVDRASTTSVRAGASSIPGSPVVAGRAP